MERRKNIATSDNTNALSEYVYGLIFEHWENYQLNKMYFYLFSSLINLRSVFYIFIYI
jgi:hypothetical protein